MKLWVDDIRNAPDDTWTVVRTVTAAIRALSRWDFEVISLDHDISHPVQVGKLVRPYPCEETFMAVAYFIAEKYMHYHRPPVLRIHTSNVPAGEEMQKVFSDVSLPSTFEPMGVANRLEQELR